MRRLSVCDAELERNIMNTLMSRSVRSGMFMLAACAALALTGCETIGKIGQTSAFDVSSASPDDIKKALDRDGRVSLTGVLFETNRARLNTGGQDRIAQLATVLKQNPRLKVAVVGHTDSTGPFQYNLDLSRSRAQSIVTSLVRTHGIEQNRLAPVGVGPLSPLASNDTAEGRAQNRRVDIVLID